MTQAIVVGTVAFGTMVAAAIGVCWFTVRGHRRSERWHDLDHSR